MHARRKKKKHLAERTSLPCLTVLCRTNDLSDKIKEILKERLKSREAFILALDESTNIRDTAQLVIFIRAVTADFDIVEEFLDMASLSSTTIGQDICEQVLEVVEKLELNCVVLQQRWCSFHDRLDKWIHHKISNCNWSTKHNCKPLHYSPRELVHQCSGFCRIHKKCCPELKLHSSTRIKSSAI